MNPDDAISGMFDPATLHFYAEQAPVYAASGAGGRNRFLDAFLDRIRPESRILDLGCGGAIDASAMLDRGFDVDAIEASPALAAIASRRLGRTVAVMRFDELTARNEYDAVWASASLIHVPRPALPSILRKVYAALRPEGVHFATYKSGGKEGRDSAGRYYSYPSAAELRSWYLASAPWTHMSVHEYVGGGFDSGNGPWISIEARRAAD